MELREPAGHKGSRGVPAGPTGLSVSTGALLFAVVYTC